MSKLNSNMLQETNSLIEQSLNLSVSEREDIFRKILSGRDGFYDPAYKDEDDIANKLQLPSLQYQQALRVKRLCYELTEGDSELDIEDCVSNLLETALKKAVTPDESFYKKFTNARRLQKLPVLQQFADEDNDIKKRLTGSIRASVNGKVTDDERWGELRFQALFCQGHVVLWNAPNVLAELVFSYQDYDFDEIMHTPDYYALRALRLINPLILVELKLRGLMDAFIEFLYWQGRSSIDEITTLTMKKHEAMYGIKENNKDVQDVIWDHACSWVSAHIMQLPKEQYLIYNPNWQKLCSRHAALLRDEMEQNVLKALYVIAEREEDFKKTWEYLRKHSLNGFFADENYDYWFKLQSALDPNKYYFLPTISKCMSIHKLYAPVLRDELLLEQRI